MKKIVFFLFAITMISCSSDDNENVTIIQYDKVSTVAAGVFKPRDLFPTALTIDGNGNIYVASFESDQIRKVDKNGVVTVLAGSGEFSEIDVNGQGEEAVFTTIVDLNTDSKGNIYFSGSHDRTLRKITPNGLVTTYLTEAEMGRQAFGFLIDKEDNLYISDATSILKFNPKGTSTVLAGKPDAWGHNDGKGEEARFSSAQFIAKDSKGNLYMKENVGAEGIRKITPEGLVTTIKITVKQDGVYVPYVGLKDAQGLAIDKNDIIYISTSNNNILQITPDGKGKYLLGEGERPSGYKDGLVGEAQTAYIGRIAFDENGDLIMIENRKNGINVRKLSRK
ncbi:hypothetical protein [Flavobacterium sp. LHD-85]|uniref:hypothetical protein n=1 Tax=Flavobacterium sp. LHD-85 TaxID=3071410 RepID=UPI0027E029D6|nr:hypothetical protein [Flavobacterium sp. LHD-85]MDQ6528260.1 hypothetical protein [Flavobacterium sp. LHD-85]